VARRLPLICLSAITLTAQDVSPAAFDALLAPYYKADAPGAAVLVTKGGKALFRKGYGLANVELGVPLQPDMVFRIGSVTKQFTGAAVLLLAEEGKIDLQQSIRHYLPELPEAWGKATVEQVLNHTAGIPDWVESPEFEKQMREDKTPAQIMLHDQGKPLDFVPGTQWAYSNTGYLALGVLIEKVSGASYYDFLKARIFKPLEMAHTGFGDETALIPRMASGYTKGPLPAPYISMKQPGAAGALVSTVDDLAKWTLALHSGKVLKPESYARMVKSYPLPNGKETRYGYGIAVRESQGRQLVWHNGEVNGFLCVLEADPASKTVAVILNNSDVRPIDDRYLSRRLIAVASGKPVVEPTPVKLAADQLHRLEGRYQSGEGKAITISAENGHLLVRTSSGRKLAMEPQSDLRFYLPGSDARMRFAEDGGKITGLYRFEDGDVEGDLMARKELVLPAVIPMEAGAFDAFVGSYELAPGFTLKVWRDGARFLAQVTGQSAADIFPEGPTKFFLKIVEAKLEFQKDAQGLVTGVALQQGGRTLSGKRIH
jgi:D-alanyl-D-alanine carboxypeptidase